MWMSGKDIGTDLGCGIPCFQNIPRPEWSNSIIFYFDWDLQIYLSLSKSFPDLQVFCLFFPPFPNSHLGWTGTVGFGGEVGTDGTSLQSATCERLSHPCWQAGTFPAEIQGASLSPYGLFGASVLVRVCTLRVAWSPFIQPEALPADTELHRTKVNSGGRFIWWRAGCNAVSKQSVSDVPSGWSLMGI